MAASPAILQAGAASSLDGPSIPAASSSNQSLIGEGQRAMAEEESRPRVDGKIEDGRWRMEAKTCLPLPMTNPPSRRRYGATGPPPRIRYGAAGEWGDGMGRSQTRGSWGSWGRA